MSVGTASAWARTATVIEGVDDDPAISLRNERLSLLGEGAQGRVYLVRHLGQLEAHKFLSVKKSRTVFREALHTRLVNHPNIVKVFGTEEADGAVVLRMEYVDGRDMARVVEDEGIFPVSELAPLAAQVADALSAAHEAGVVHQDLKPSNLILHRDRQRVVVTDFGVSAALRSAQGAPRRRAGTPIFMAPELLEGRGGATPRADIWSLGVTLYYLTCGSYPFAFDELSPAEAVQHPPRDPRPEAPHVCAEFWDILQRMLSRDPQRVYSSMGEVRDALVDLVERVGCPACGERIALLDIERNCPRCGSTRISPWLDISLQRSAAETELARCEFVSAGRRLESTARTSRAAGYEALAEELSRLAEVAGQRDRECRASVLQIREDLEQERFVQGVSRLERGWARFSRSPELKALRGDRDRVLAKLYHETEPRAACELRHGAFEAARGVLDRLGEVLDDPLAQRALEHAIGQTPDDFEWLREEIRRKQEIFRELSSEADRALHEFHFERALGALGRIEDEFPSEDNVELMQRLRRAQETIEAARPCPPEILARLLADPLTPIEEQFLPLELQLAERSCRELLENFPVDEYPSFSSIVQERQRLLAVTGAIQDVVRAKLAETERAESERRIRDALEALESVRQRVFESDVFGAEEREALEQRIGTLRELADRAAELYSEGLEAMQRRDHPKAKLALAEVTAIAPHDFPDAPELSAEIDTLRDRTSALSEQVTKEFAEIRRGRFTPESACAILSQAEALWELSEDTRRERLEADMGEVIGALVDSQVEYLENQARLSPAATSAFLREALVPLVHSLSEERWLAIQLRHPELQRGLVRATCAGLAELEKRPFSEALEDVKKRVAAFSEITPVISRIELEPLSQAFAVACCAQLVTSFQHAAPALRKQRGTELLQLLRDLRLFTPSVAQPIYDKHVDRAKRLSTRANWTRVARRVGGVLLYLGPLLATGAASWYYGNDWGAKSAERDVLAHQAELIAELGFSGPTGELLQRWLRPETGALRTDTARVALLAGWQRMRATVEDPDSDRGAHQAHLALGKQRELLLVDPALAGPLRSFDEALGVIVDRSVAEAVESAVEAHLELRLPGDTVLRALSIELANLGLAVGPQTPLQAQLQALEARLEATVLEQIPAAISQGLAEGQLAVRCRELYLSLASEPFAPGLLSPATAGELHSYLAAEIRAQLIERLAQLWRRSERGDLSDFHAHSEQLIDALAQAVERESPLESRRSRALRDRDDPVDRVLEILDPRDEP